MIRDAWKYLHIGLAAVAMVGALVSCNSHPLVGPNAQPGSVVVINPPPVMPPPPPVTLSDAGLPTTSPYAGPVVISPSTTTTTTSPPSPHPVSDAGSGWVQPATLTPDAGPPPPVDTGPPVENLSCPAGEVRLHVRDVWSDTVDPPSMKTMSTPPTSVQIMDTKNNYTVYAARVDGANCSYYSVCLPNTVTIIELKPVGADGCATGSQSGNFDISAYAKNSDVWLEYTGTDSTIQADYTNYPTANVGAGQFHLTSDASTLQYPACKVGTPPDESVPSGYTKVEFRWPWNDPTDPATPYPGSGCPLNFATTMGFTVPPYPSSLSVTGLRCPMEAVLEFQDGQCPWYYVMIPNSEWPISGSGPQIVFRYNAEAYTNSIQLPARDPNQTEYWIAYADAPDNTIASVTMCQDWSLQPNSYFIYTANPGPGYQNCGGSVAPVDPCSPPQPANYHTVHFRYLWAGQVTFTMFPSQEIMPKWIELEVTPPNGGTIEVICQHEQQRPWYECPVPDTAFSATTTWRAVDKLHNPEWNTVQPWPFGTTAATPGEYWIRWYYGKPDIPRNSPPPNFMIFNYYPDGTNGDWSATGNWDDSMCAPKPPATPVVVGFNEGGWFPYSQTQYQYPYGGSLAYIYPQANQSQVQDLLNAFTFERYNLWKQNWVLSDSNACGTGTARVYSDDPTGTVSEGQGYGMAMAAAIGDKDLFDQLWNFIRDYRSEQKYCGLMGWMFPAAATDSTAQYCQAQDSFASSGGDHDSAFDGDVDIGIGLVFGALQWPEYTSDATDWLTRMECEVNTKYGDGYNYPTCGDSWDKNCESATQCGYDPGTVNNVFVDYYPPGYFRVFGDFLAAKLGSSAQAANGQTHHDFWYKTAETVWKLVELCYDQAGVHPGLMGDQGDILTACSSGGGEPYEWGRALWRLAIDAAWFGDNTSLPENTPNSSLLYPGKSQIQAKMDNIQDFYANFYKNNPPVPGANQFSTICDQMGTDGTITNCDPAYGHNSYTVNLALCPFATEFNDGGATTSAIRQAAIEESVSTTIQNDHYFQESLGVYSMLFLSGNFPNPMTAAGN